MSKPSLEEWAKQMYLDPLAGFESCNAEYLDKLLADSKRLAELKEMLKAGCNFSAQPSQHTKGYMQAMGEILRMLEEPDHE